MKTADIDIEKLAESSGCCLNSILAGGLEKGVVIPFLLDRIIVIKSDCLSDSESKIPAKFLSEFYGSKGDRRCSC